MIKRVTVKDLDECEYRCYLNANCVSLNIKNKDPTNGTHQCELNNSTHLEDDGYLEDNKLFYYRGAENKCGRNGGKCKNNSTCQSGFTHKGYRCSCTTGFKGEHCKKDIDECAARVNPCDAVANSECKNIDGSYNCQCKDGFVKIGATCEVDVCRGYKVLNSADRKDTYTRETGLLCDSGLTEAWYRFEGDAGTRMLTTCVDKYRCATHSPGCLKGGHPTVADGEVRRKVCFGPSPDCCKDRKYITVKNCSSYYVYKLGGTPGCDLRYCGTDSP